MRWSSVWRAVNNPTGVGTRDKKKKEVNKRKNKKKNKKIKKNIYISAKNIS